MKLAVFVSGSGTNLQALLDAETAGILAPGEIECVISNRPGVGALDRALAAGKPTIVIDHKHFTSRAEFEDALFEKCAFHEIEAVVLAGFMRLLTPRFLEHFPDKILNIHPSLLPAFPGVDAQAQAYAHGVKVTGCTVHLVEAGLDSGPIVLQAPVPVLPDDDVDKLRARILVQEHVILPRAVHLLAADKLVRDGRRILIRP